MNHELQTKLPCQPLDNNSTMFFNGQRLNICLSKNGRRLESNFINVYQMHSGSLVGQCSGKGNYEKVKSGTDIRIFSRNSANQSFTV